MNHLQVIYVAAASPPNRGGGANAATRGPHAAASIWQRPLDRACALCHRSWRTAAWAANTVRNDSLRGFGLLIAYVLPGFTVLLGLATVFDPVRVWLLGADSAQLTVGGVLYITAASVTIGMILNAIRWAVFDTLHHATGVTKPSWDDARLADRLPAFERLVEDHFRYYQFYANTALASLIAFAAWRSSAFYPPALSPWAEMGLAVLEFTLVAASRDALKRYYRRTSALLVSRRRRSS